MKCWTASESRRSGEKAALRIAVRPTTHIEQVQGSTFSHVTTGITMKITELPHKGEYVRMIREVRAAFARGVKTVRLGYDQFYTREQWERVIWIALNQRINSRGGLGADCQCETCVDPDQMARFYRDQQRLRNIHKRIRVYQFETEECRRRFGHLLSHYDD